MSIYRYPESKIVDEITFQKSEGGQTRAYLHAIDGVDQKTLNNITCAFADNGWQVTPYTLNGKPTLEVLGFKSQLKLRQALEQAGWIKGTEEFIGIKQDKLSFIEQVRKRSLGASGIAYVLGDASFTQYGYADKNPWNLAGGLMYGVGTASLLTGGRKDQSDLQVKDISKKMAQHFRDIDIALPKDCSLTAITEDHNKGLIKSADDLIRRYPSELMNLFFAAAGTCIAIAAYKSLHKAPDPKKFEHEVGEVLERLTMKAKKKGLPLPTASFVGEKMKFYHKVESMLDIGLGAMTGLSGLFAMSVKEKAPDPDEAPKEGLARAWEFVREKPLAIAGVGYMVSTLCHAVSTTIAWNYADNERRKSVPWRAVFVGANLVAELLLAISSKGHGDGVKSDGHVDKTVIALASELIVKQPKAMQEYLINHMAGFLGRADVLAMKNDEAVRQLRTEVEAMRKNPWAQGVQAQQKTPSTELAPAPAEKPRLAGWEAKMAAAKPDATPGLSA